jgi:alpha-galactosidase
MSPEAREILTNKEVLAVNQDKLGHAGKRISKDGDAELWGKPLDQGAYAVAFFNRDSVTMPVSIRWSSLQLNGTPKLRDLWPHADHESNPEGFTVNVPAHDAVLLRISP